MGIIFNSDKCTQFFETSAKFGHWHLTVRLLDHKMLRKFLTVGFGVANPIGLLLVKALVVAAVVKLEIGSLYTSSCLVGLTGSARFDACLFQKPSFKVRTENRTVLGMRIPREAEAEHRTRIHSQNSST
jgi:hypothetical protein